MFTISINPLIFICPFIIGWYSLIVVIAAEIAVWPTAKEAEQRGMKKDDIYGVAIWILIGGAIGA